MFIIPIHKNHYEWIAGVRMFIRWITSCQPSQQCYKHWRETLDILTRAVRNVASLVNLVEPKGKLF